MRRIEESPAAFAGFDHVDTRVRSLASVEPFYDRLMPELGLTRKRYAVVDAAGEWGNAADGDPYNVVEYYEESPPGRFIGFIEDPKMQPVKTRIAFRAAAREDLPRWEAFLVEIGAHRVERSADMEQYPAIFFEDPAGTCLEVCARN